MAEDCAKNAKNSHNHLKKIAARLPAKTCPPNYFYLSESDQKSEDHHNCKEFEGKNDCQCLGLWKCHGRWCQCTTDPPDTNDSEEAKVMSDPTNQMNQKLRLDTLESKNKNNRKSFLDYLEDELLPKSG